MYSKFEEQVRFEIKYPFLLNDSIIHFIIVSYEKCYISFISLGL